MIVERRILETGAAGGAGTGRTSQPSSRLSPKDVRVDKLSEKADLSEFRRWQRTIELQLEHCFSKPHMDEIILAIRHTTEPITEQNWLDVLKRVNEEGMKANPMEWEFDSQSRWLYSYLCPN